MGFPGRLRVEYLAEVTAHEDYRDQPVHCFPQPWTAEGQFYDPWKHSQFYRELRDGSQPADVPGSMLTPEKIQLLDAGADIVGMNCGRGPDRAIVIIREMRQVTDAPLIAYPNAGLPITTGGRTTYELGPEAMAKDYPALLDAGCNIVGGCCGSNPEHIRLIADVVRSRRAR